MTLKERCTDVLQSLEGRLVASTFVILLVTLSVAGVITAREIEATVREQISGRLELQLASVAAAYEAGRLDPNDREGSPRPRGPEPLQAGNPPTPPWLLAGRFVDAPPFDRPRSGWYWQMQAGGERFSSASLATGSLLEAIEREGPPASGPALLDIEPAGAGDLVARVERATVGGRSAILVASAPAKALTAPVRRAVGRLAVALSLLALLVSAVVVLVVRFGLRPMQALRASLEAVREGRAEAVPTRQPREVRPLALELNALIAQDAANLKAARLHVANLAHGLKTPLATLAAAIERRAGDRSDAEILRLVELMDIRIRHHLRRARSAALGGPARRRLAIRERIDDLVSTMQMIQRDRRIETTTDLPGDAAVGVEAEDFDEMLGNLLDNAFRHAGTSVGITVAASGRDWSIAIEDDGPGMSPAALAHVRRPGRRADESTPGHGFGIPIAAELAELYGGRLDLEPAGASRSGLRSVLTLPRAGG